MGVLDPAGVPLFSQTLAGHQADDPLYVSAWRQMHQTIGHKNFLYVGDSKGGAFETRQTIDQEKGRYLFPLAMTGRIRSDLETLVLSPSTCPIKLPNKEGELVTVGQGFKIASPHLAQENWLVLKSDAHARRQEQALLSRLDKTERAITKLKPKSGETASSFEQRLNQHLKQVRLTHLLHVKVTETATLEKRYLKRGRPGPDSPYRFIGSRTLSVELSRLQEEIERERRLCGWRIYATNHDTLDHCYPILSWTMVE